MGGQFSSLDLENTRLMMHRLEVDPVKLSSIHFLIQQTGLWKDYQVLVQVRMSHKSTLWGKDLRAMPLLSEFLTQTKNKEVVTLAQDFTTHQAKSLSPKPQ